mmetsp:Transcript_28842/g.43554  ORF Transcript_28842/g.43554 Transcript_28842/m.43554 type:complete len:131 (+) Transcript_28842:195-587(+)|eukprot:CAMPEP_0178902444 /NCGR_PEP_ID=MMETSP0786-20121207/4605_1 /TAXON_ID=186022 /ORGANISM="Thalassionema frauenfeldii, Strain CCMP 1798" /LENGTH=130 /DNA_ID=CAMNT_0020573705 /DNA_START=113 /DNA_END=505 /DNA_ORIENTATION=-
MSVIDWDEAMEQCGDDEDFLRELLADLREETTQQLAKMDETLRNPADDSYHRIMRASHVIKGAASNLMCQQLRTAAMDLETAAKEVHSYPANEQAEQSKRLGFTEKHQALTKASNDFCAHLESLNIFRDK